MIDDLKVTAQVALWSTLKARNCLVILGPTIHFPAKCRRKYERECCVKYFLSGY